MSEIAVAIPEKAIEQFCERWKICELAVFGSVLRDDFRADSDVDILVSFTEDASWGLLAHVQMQQELEALLGRPVDLISRRGLEESQNWLRRDAILQSTQVIFKTGEVLHVS